MTRKDKQVNKIINDLKTELSQLLNIDVNSIKITYAVDTILFFYDNNFIYSVNLSNYINYNSSIPIYNMSEYGKTLIRMFLAICDNESVIIEKMKNALVSINK